MAWDGAPGAALRSPVSPGDGLSLSHHGGAGKEVVMEIS